MNPLTASRLLSVWERGYQQSPLNRALVMFEVAAPEFNRELVLSLPVGQRDALLFRLRERTFGSRFESEASCPSCGDHLEFSFEVTDILHNVDVQAPQTCVWNDRGYSLNYPPINTLDLLEASRLDYSRSAEMFVLERCIISAAHNGKETSLTELPSDVLDGLMTDRQEPIHTPIFSCSCRVLRALTCGKNRLISFRISGVKSNREQKGCCRMSIVSLVRMDGVNPIFCP